MFELATFVPLTCAHVLPPLVLSVGVVGNVDVAVPACPASWTRSKSFAFTVAGMVKVNVPDADTDDAVLLVRYAPGSIVYGEGSVASSSARVRNCCFLTMSSRHISPAGVTSPPRKLKIFTGGIATDINLFVRRSKKPTQPRSLTRASSGVSSRQRHVRGPSFLSTVRNSSAFSPLTATASLPNDVWRSVPFAYDVCALPSIPTPDKAIVPPEPAS